jgi:uncharacterized metal-binding protein
MVFVIGIEKNEKLDKKSEDLIKVIKNIIFQEYLNNKYKE